MTRAQCLKLARYAARSAGFASVAAMHAHVITRGWQSGTSVVYFNALQCIYLHVVQPLVWAAEGTGEERARWVRHAHKGAFLSWVTGAALRAAP